MLITRKSQFSPTETSNLTRQTIVKPTKGGPETQWLLAIAFVTLAVCALTISMRTGSTTEKEIESWQINAFQTLNGSEIGVFNGLQTAAVEIDETHEMEGDYWITVNELQALYIPPFAQDAAWHKQGELAWTRKILEVEGRHIALYKGVPAKDQVRGVFLLLMLHDHRKKQGNVAACPTHAPFEIWFHDRLDQEFPEVITDQAIIASGWKEIVALTGEDEVIKMKGKAIQ